MGQKRIDAGSHGQTLPLAGHLVEGYQLIKQGQQIKGFAIHRHLIRLDLAEIEQIVDQGHEAGGRGTNELGEMFLPRLQLGIEKEFTDADHAIHRGADLVTDHGQKIRFGLISGVGLLCFLPQFGTFPLKPFYLCLQFDNLGLQLFQLVHIRKKVRVVDGSLSASLLPAGTPAGWTSCWPGVLPETATVAGFRRIRRAMTVRRTR